MGKKTTDFEALYTDLTECCSQPLDWEWEEDSLKFTSTCDCLINYELYPSIAKMVITREDEIEED
mgnify:CR=1 FL=1